MGEEPDEIEGTSESRARVSSDEVEVRVRESALSRAEEECAPVVCHLRFGEPVCQPQKAAAGSMTRSSEAANIPPGSSGTRSDASQRCTKHFF